VEFLVLAALVAAKRPEGAKLVLAGIAVVVIGASAALTEKVQLDREAVGAARTMERDPRLALWPQVLQKIEQRPLTGYGFGRGMLRTAFINEFKEVQLWHAHNVFLDVAIQVGLPGVVLLAVLLGATLRQAWNLLRNPDIVAAACGIALAAVVAGMLARNMTDMLWVRQNALLYWGVVGALLGLGRIRADAAR
jgi:O-antigen ligase